MTNVDTHFDVLPAIKRLESTGLTIKPVLNRKPTILHKWANPNKPFYPSLDYAIISGTIPPQAGTVLKIGIRSKQFLIDYAERLDALNKEKTNE